MNQEGTLTKFRLKNFRSFADTGDIEIKPINFLVGANSSGKSSILKFFPLLKQSIGGRPFNGVLNWYGDEVDFKDFSNTVRTNEKQITINMESNDNLKISFEIIKEKELFDTFKSFTSDSYECHCHLKKGEIEKTHYDMFMFSKEKKYSSEEKIALGRANMFMWELVNNIKYIKPIRANIERYYRLRNDSIEDIASDGSNLPMFLLCLTSAQFRHFNVFLRENFGFASGIKKSEGNIEIHISEKDNLPRNAVDMGYGYTEMLPILATIWNSIYKKNDSLIVIEQPEVHLHPKFQAKFAKMLCKVINKYTNVSFFIETHSETILNTIGAEIDYDRANAEDINVLLIEKNNGISTVKSTGYDNNGYLKDWPANFLDENADYN